jgi:cobalt-zinc-cadmium efflux system protein
MAVDQQQRERRTLFHVLLLNVGLTVTLAIGGYFADSSALVANAVDNASDAAVYALSYIAVGRSERLRNSAATLSGILLLLLAVGVLIEVIRRFTVGAEPIGGVMIAMAIVASAINAWCLRLLSAVRKDNVNLRAAWTFSVNDFLSNFGIIVAGVLVWWLGRTWPDLVVGAAVALMAGWGGIEILRDAKESRGESRELVNDGDKR